MLRGGIFIGVNKTTGGGLPVLKAAAAGAKEMYDWAVASSLGGMAPDHAHLLVDDDGAVVTPQQVIDAVQTVIDHGVDQLVLYFSGHGVIIDNSETWLLSKAPQQGSAAISVFMSALDARSGRTPHVVIISDACRTPAKDLQGQRITPVSAFPNDPIPGPGKRVDVFYACATGQAAIELNTINAQGIYTDILHDALIGHAPSILSPAEIPGDRARYIWSGPLGEYLEQAVADRLIERKIDQDQTPAFEVQYGTKNLRWLARFEPRLGDLDLDVDLKGLAPPITRGGIIPRRGGLPSGQGRFIREQQPAIVDEARTVSQLADALLRGIVEDRDTPFAAQLRRAATAPAPGARAFIATVAAIAAPFGGPFDDPTTAVTIRGTSLASAQSADSSIRLASKDRITHDNSGSLNTSVVVSFTNDIAAVLPIIAGFTTAVLVRDREIISVALEPTSTTPAQLDTSSRIRWVRAVVAASARHGRLNIAHDALEVVRRLNGGVIDPTTALYASYGSYALGLEQVPAELFDELRRSGVDLFDIAMLANHLPPHGLADALAPRPRPFLPLLSHGWQLLMKFGLDTAEPFMTLKSSVLPSLWTAFRASATDALLNAEVTHR